MVMAGNAMLASSLSQLNQFNLQCLNVFTKRRFPPSLPFRQCAVEELSDWIRVYFRYLDVFSKGTTRYKNKKYM